MTIDINDFREAVLCATDGYVQFDDDTIKRIFRELHRIELEND